MADTERNKAIVRDFFARWGTSFDSMIDSFRAHLAPDCLLKMTRTPHLSGIDEIVSFMDKVRAAGIIETMDVDIERLVAEDECVVCERVDVMRNAAGEIVATFPTYSLMDFVDGRIVEWHDYFDSADMPTGGVEVVNS